MAHTRLTAGRSDTCDSCDTYFKNYRESTYSFWFLGVVLEAPKDISNLFMQELKIALRYSSTSEHHFLELIKKPPFWEAFMYDRLSI